MRLLVKLRTALDEGAQALDEGALALAEAQVKRSEMVGAAQQARRS